MALEAPVAAAPARSDAARKGSSRAETLIALGVYAAISLLFFGSHAVPHLGSQCPCGYGNDAGSSMWDLAWWPHALFHGINPFFTDGLFAPDRINLGGFTLLSVPALVAAPVTLLFGPLVSYNLLALASPMLAALFAFLLCRYLTRSFPAALVGGYLFGFSTYMLGEMLGGHLPLVLTFPIPAGVHLFLRLIDGRISRRPFIALMALDLAALFTFAPELALTFVIIGALTVGLALALAPQTRGQLLAAIRPTVMAGVLAAIITSPLIYYALNGNIPNAFSGTGDMWGGDALGLLVPTRLIAFLSSSFTVVSSSFSDNDLAESGIYLGLPLLLIVGRYIATRWRLPATRALLSIFLVVWVLLLGSHLHIDGHPTISLPWRALANLPLVEQALPVRLGVYLFLVVALVVALWSASPRAGAWGVAKWALVAVSLAVLFPNLGSPFWRGRPSNPRFFTTTEYRRYLHRGETVLALPWPGLTGYGMLWQADTGMWFRLAGANLGKLVPPDYLRDPMYPAFIHPGAASDAPYLRSFLIRRHVGAVIVDASSPQQWPAVLAALGLRAVDTGGVLFYRVPSGRGAAGTSHLRH
jgi:hypothetical protein